MVGSCTRRPAPASCGAPRPATALPLGPAGGRAHRRARRVGARSESGRRSAPSAGRSGPGHRGRPNAAKRVSEAPSRTCRPGADSDWRRCQTRRSDGRGGGGEGSLVLRAGSGRARPGGDGWAGATGRPHGPESHCAPAAERRHGGRRGGCGSGPRKGLTRTMPPRPRCRGLVQLARSLCERPLMGRSRLKVPDLTIIVKPRLALLRQACRSIPVPFVSYLLLPRPP